MSEQILDIILPVFFGLLILGGIALYIYCIVDVHRKEVRYHADRSTWLNLIWMAPVIGCIIYLLNRKELHRRSRRRF